MRCSSAVTQSLIMHPRYKNIPWVTEEAFKNACGQDDYRYTIVLPSAEAYKVIEAAKGEIIKTLIKLGFEEDSRVVSACENFIRMREKYGGWCDSNVRNTLIEESKFKRK